MIEIRWAKERSLGSTIFTGNYCGLDCSLYDGYNLLCCADYAVEDEEIAEIAPGPKCPGPGTYVLTKVEV